MKFIPLSGGRRQAIVDDEDYEWLSQTKWSDDSRGYAIRKVSGQHTTEKMHRLILDAQPDDQIDHINGKPWDNRKENLRIASARQNSANKGPYSTNKSGYKGVAARPDGRWSAQITVNYRKIHLGLFDSPLDAAVVYNDAARQYFGEYAKLNNVTRKDDAV